MFKDDEKHETHYCENCLKLSEQLEKQKQECEKYKQALDEIEKYCNKYPTNSIRFKKNILDIINKAKDGK